ncbi:HTH-type transcriptional regulator DmlR [Halomonadaceae bacterium LMG 33818]|uniref:LysR family transcriptional regulator n=1 Tax=Cernens ardua TaxID=3402176 RepID=UPI003EDBA1A0
MDKERLVDIETFITVVDTGSYTNAARKLGLSRSTVGKRILRLEERFEVRLLNRTTRQLSLTDEGDVFYQRCRQITSELEDLEDTMSQRRQAPTGVLKISAPQALGNRYIYPLLESFLRRWPGLRVEVSFTDRYVELIEEGIDIAIRIGEPLQDSRILSRTVGTQEMITCASPAYLERKGIPVSPDELEGHDTIMFLNANYYRTWSFKSADHSWQHTGPVKLNMNDAEAMLKAALSGLGITYLPSFLVKDALKSGDLVPLLEDYAEQSEPIRVIYPSRRFLSPRIRLFIDFLVEEWQPILPWDK